MTTDSGMLCEDLIAGTRYPPGDERRITDGKAFVKVPCGLPTTRRCKRCDQPTCVWHKVANHDH